MTRKISVAILHYHLRPGGVTRVIERTLEALGDSVDFVILPGESPKPDAPLASLSEPFQSLAYSEQIHSDPAELTAELRFTARCLLGRDPDIWHIHNHSLGKNTATPQIAWHLANQGCRLLLQPHDFAEDGRPENYRLLREGIGTEKLNHTLYPIGDHIFYTPINSRDQTFLQKAGIPNVFLLPNAIPPFPVFPPPTGDHRTFVYPARAIRRKNMGEFLLWSLLAPEGDRFISTLAPQNPEVRPIYDEWVRFAKELKLPVEFDAGNRLPFNTLIQNASALMTTSIAEGFGLAFLEPWMAGRMLFGRNIPAITSDFTDQGLNLSGLYNHLPVPLEWAGKKAFEQTLLSAMQTSYNAYCVPWNPDFFDQAMHALTSDGMVDFGILSEPLQRNVIRHLADHPTDQERLPPFDFEQSDDVIIEHNLRIIETRYGLAAYAKRLSDLYERLANTPPGEVTSGVSDHILKQFLKPERFNLLRT